MKYEGDVNYAADPYGYRPPETPKRKGFLGLGLAVAGIVAFAGSILFVYRGSDRMNPDGTPPLLTADTSPAKSRPDQPGGMEVPHQDKLVYERLHEKGTQPNIERLLPPPEAPLPRPVVTPAMPGPTPLPSAPAIAQMPPPPPGSTATVPREMVGQPPGPVASAAAPTAQTPPPAAAKPAPAKPASTSASTSSSAPAGSSPPAATQRQTVVPQPPKAPPAPAQAAAPAAAAAQANAAPAPKPVPVSTASLPPPAPAPQPAGQQPAAPQAAAQPPKPSTPAGGAGNWRVQLASVRSESEATAEWKRLSGKHADALGGVGMQIVKADLGEKGIFYRVQGGGIDESRAKSVCAQLRAQNVGCVVVRP